MLYAILKLDQLQWRLNISNFTLKYDLHAELDIKLPWSNLDGVTFQPGTLTLPEPPYFTCICCYCLDQFSQTCRNFLISLGLFSSLLPTPRVTIVHFTECKVFHKLNSSYIFVLCFLWHDQDMSKRFSSDRTTTPVRVRDSICNNYGEGRVEFLRNEQWISAYFYPWESPDARLFCKLLGYQYVWIHLPLINAWVLCSHSFEFSASAYFPR